MAAAAPLSAAPPAPTFLGSSTADTRLLATSLGAGSTLDAPAGTPTTGWAWDGPPYVALDAWRATVEALPSAPAVVVCCWSDPVGPTPLTEVSPEAWRSLVEWPTALWFTTLVAAAERCADGGSLAVVLDRPATLDAPGWAPSVAVADGLANLVRSLAAVHGPRAVRVNAVTTALHLVAEPLLGPPPPLATFPGRVEVEVAGAVRVLLSPDSVGVTGTVLHAGSGR